MFTKNPEAGSNRERYRPLDLDAPWTTMVEAVKLKGMKVNRSLIWDYDFSERDYKTEAFEEWYLGRVLSKGSAGDIRDAGGREAVRRHFAKLHLPIEVERLWSWHLGIPGPRAHLYDPIDAFSRRIP